MLHKFGCLPNDPSKPRVKLAHVEGALPAPDAQAGYYGQVPANAWGMLGNDSAGDCVAASALHGEQLVQKVARGVDTGFSTQDALTMYSAISGYNPNDPSTDVGATLQDGLTYWRKTGVGAAGYKLEAFAEIDYRNTNLLKNAVKYFGVTYAALAVPQTAMTQFDKGQPWDVTRGRAQIVGGHAVPIVGYDAQYLYVVTWAAIQRVTWAFYSKYFQENWVPIDADWLSVSGMTPSGLDFASANADYQALTGDSSSPFPQVTPPVDPPVDPPVTPPSGDAVALLTSVKASLDANSAAIAAFLASQQPAPHVHGH